MGGYTSVRPNINCLCLRHRQRLRHNPWNSMSHLYRLPLQPFLEFYVQRNHKLFNDIIAIRQCFFSRQNGFRYGLLRQLKYQHMRSRLCFFHDFIVERSQRNHRAVGFVPRRCRQRSQLHPKLALLRLNFRIQSELLTKHILFADYESKLR